MAAWSLAGVRPAKITVVLCDMERQRNLLAQRAARSGDDGNLAMEIPAIFHPLQGGGAVVVGVVKGDES